MSHPSTRTLFYCIPFLFVLIYFQVFYTDYAYLDEIYALWHNNDKTNYSVTQGRWLSGLIFQKFYSSISTIGQLKSLRLVSLTGWVITAYIWAYLFKKWAKLLELSNETWLIGSLYVVCSISVCIYIGWAACMQIFFGVLAALVGSHIFFQNIYSQQKEIHLGNRIIATSLLLGIISLFFYQNTFGIFLIPFFLHYVRGKKPKVTRVVVIGIVFYLLTYVFYYLLFRYSLKAYHLPADNRTEINFHFLKKVSFFFSGPFPQGFSMNLLFLARSIFSQIFYVLIFIAWLAFVFKRNKQNTIIGNLIFIGVILFFLALIYLPSMIATENFPPYRTLFAFNLAVFILVIDSLMFLFQKKRQRKIVVRVVSLWLILTAFYTFNFQFVNPLKKEYKVLKNFVDGHYKDNLTQVYFVRADKFLFSSEFHTRVYRDELGAPSTYRDWVPEAITKQLIFEITKNRRAAENVTVTQFENIALFNKSKPFPDSNSLFIDMNKIFNSAVK